MNIQSLRFRAISHLSQGEVVEYLSSLASNRIQARPPIDGTMERDMDNVRGQPQNRQSARMQEPLRDSYIEEFVGKNADVNRLKEECSKLRFQKIALESSVTKLKEEVMRKDEIIRNLTAQVQQGSKPNITSLGNIRHTITPIY